MDEFDESDIYGAAQEEPSGSDVSEDDGESSRGHSADQEASAVPERQQSASGSKGRLISTLGDINEHEAVATGAEDVKLTRAELAAAFGSLPAGKAVAMGSSVPICIPGMPIRKKQAPGVPADELVYPGTFVPPHEMQDGQQDAIMFSLTGNEGVKRDRLRARNAILQSTGFLEKSVEVPPTIGLQERTRLSNPTGGLSQAFHPTTPGLTEGA